jgi:hypothetical protein
MQPDLRRQRHGEQPGVGQDELRFVHDCARASDHTARGKRAIMKSAAGGESRAQGKLSLRGHQV